MTKRVAIFIIVAVFTLDFSTGRHPYNDLLKKYAKEYRLNLDIVQAVAHVENAPANPKAKSHAGAIGLMQIMPIALEEYYRVEKRMSFSMNQATIKSMLKLPEINIAISCWCLRYLLNKHKGNYVLALESYNSGYNSKTKNWDYPNKILMRVLTER